MKRKVPEDAFELYVSMGEERSYAAVAEKLGVSKRSISRKAREEDWPVRLARIQAQARERSDARMVETLDEMRSRHLRMLRAMAGRALSALSEYRLESGMDAMRAAALVIKLERLIAGEPTDRTTLGIEEVVRRESVHWLTVMRGDGNPERDDGDVDAESA